jgi:hypothetical protein
MRREVGQLPATHPPSTNKVCPVTKSDAALLIIDKGITQGMNQFNKKPFKLLNS